MMPAALRTTTALLIRTATATLLASFGTRTTIATLRAGTTIAAISTRAALFALARTLLGLRRHSRSDHQRLVF
jgi:hypothetical protein